MNFGRIKQVYLDASIAHPQCNYSSFVDSVTKMEETTSQWPIILQDPKPTFEKLNSQTTILKKLAKDTNESIRKYIRENEKDCYFTPRRVRQSALTISNYVIQILTKCVQYRDAANSKC